MEQSPPSAAKSALLLMAFGTITQILSFFYRVALSRLIGAELMGLYQLLMSAYSVLIALTAIGLTAATSNLSAQYLALHNRRGADQLRRLTLCWFLLLLLPTALIVIRWSDEISVYLLGDARTQLGLLLLLPCVLLTGIENIHKHFFYGTGQVRGPALIELLEQAIRGVAVLGLLILVPPSYAERQVALIVLGMVICEIFSALSLIGLYRLWVRRNPLHGAGEQSSALCRRVLDMALPIGANALLGNLIAAANTTLLPQKLVVSGMARQEAMIQFGIICGMTLPMLALPTVLLSSMNLVLIPRLSRSVALGRRDLIAHYISRSISVVSITMLPALALMAVLGGDLGILLFQQDGVDHYLLPLVISMAFCCYQSTFCAILNGISHQKASATISLCCGLLQLCLTIIAVPIWGLSGYVAGVLLSAVVGTLLAGQTVMRAAKISPQLFRHFVAPTLAALLMALCGNLLHLWLQSRGIPLLTVCVSTALFSAVLYIAALEGQGISLRQTLRIG